MSQQKNNSFTEEQLKELIKPDLMVGLMNCYRIVNMAARQVASGEELSSTVKAHLKACSACANATAGLSGYN